METTLSSAGPVEVSERKGGSTILANADFTRKEAMIFRWLWLLLAVAALLCWIRITQYQHTSFEAVWVGDRREQLELRESVWDRWHQQPCFMVRGVKTKASSRDYARTICWGSDRSETGLR